MSKNIFSGDVATFLSTLAYIPYGNTGEVPSALQKGIMDSNGVVSVTFSDTLRLAFLTSSSGILWARVPTRAEYDKEFVCACGVETTAYFTCGGCGVYFYCSRACQVKAWPSHKIMCKGASPACGALVKPFAHMFSTLGRLANFCDVVACRGISVLHIVVCRLSAPPKEEASRQRKADAAQDLFRALPMRRSQTAVSSGADVTVDQALTMVMQTFCLNRGGASVLFELIDGQGVQEDTPKRLHAGNGVYYGVCVVPDTVQNVPFLEDTLGPASHEGILQSARRVYNGLPDGNAAKSTVVYMTLMGFDSVYPIVFSRLL